MNKKTEKYNENKANKKGDFAKFDLDNNLRCKIYI